MPSLENLDPQHLKLISYGVDGISAAAIIGTIAGFLPPLAALGGVIWYAIQIWESKTVQRWLRLHRTKKRRARLEGRDAKPPE